MTDHTPAPGAVYRTLWRWHFYAGLLCLPILASLAISGAIYLFKPQLDAAAAAPYRDLGAFEARPVAEQIGAAMAAHPTSRLVSVALPEPGQALPVTLADGPVQRLLYVHPETLAILGDTPVDSQFVQQVKAFHGELLAGDVGAVVVELAGNWAIVLLVTGLYLWWPRRRGLGGVLYPRLGRGRRVVLRDLHAVTGFYAAFFALFLLISGLPWALVWGSAFQEARAWLEPSVEQSWSVRSGGDHAEHMQARSLATEWPSEAVWRAALAAEVARPAQLRSAGPALWQLASEHQNRTLRSEITFNHRTGIAMAETTFSQRPLVDRVIGVAIAAHEGALFGVLNVALGLFTCAAIVCLVVTGSWMWWRRKPADALGAPPPLPATAQSKGLLAIVIGLALVLPLLAASLLVLWLLDLAVTRRLPRLRAWLGLRPAAGTGG